MTSRSRHPTVALALVTGISSYEGLISVSDLALRVCEQPSILALV